MKDKILQSLMPFVENFVDNLCKVQKDIENGYSNIENSLKKIKESEDYLKALTVELKNKHDEQLRKLHDSINEHNVLSNQIKVEINTVSIQKKELETIKQESQQILEESKKRMAMASSRLEEADKLNKNYQDKLKILDTDFATLQKKNYEQISKEKELKTLEKVLLSKQDEVNKLMQAVNDKETDLKLKEQELVRQLKKLKLEVKESK